MYKEANRRVIAAIDCSKRFVPEYWQKCQDQRDPRTADAAGSTLRLPPAYTGTIENMLRASAWFTFDHHAVLPQCSAVATFDLCGRIGIVELAQLDDDRVLEISDLKGTGYADVIMPLTQNEADAMRPRTGLTVMILGPSDHGELVWTFHPGAPVPPSTFPTPATRTITVRDAIFAGVRHAKIRVV